MLSIHRHEPPPASSAASPKHFLLPRDQWVTTSLRGAIVTGRVLSKLEEPDGWTLYEIELPLQTRQGGMTRIMRSAGELRPVADDTLP